MAVNYLWISKEGVPSTIPSFLFYRLQQNTQNYKNDAKFTLWLNNFSSVGNYRIPPNLSIRNVEELPPLSPLGQAATIEGDFWIHIDRLKLQIVAETLKQNPTIPSALFTDLDIPDIRLNDTALQQRLQSYGMAFGATFLKDSKGRIHIKDRYENGYMAFSQTSLSTLEHMIHHMKDYRMADRHTIFWAIHNFMDIYARKQGISSWMDSIGRLPVQPPCNDHSHLPYEQAERHT